MNLLTLPWVELSILVPVVGAICVSRLREPLNASRWGLVFTGTTLACALLACVAYYSPVVSANRWELAPRIHGDTILVLDAVSAPLLPLVAGLHFLAALATGRTKMRRFSFAWSLAEESLRMGIIACPGPWTPITTGGTAEPLVFQVRLWLLIGLLIACVVPPYFELLSRQRSGRIYALHMGLFAGLMVLGGVLVDPSVSTSGQAHLESLPFLAAVLIRCGTIPAHAWLANWFENASFGNAILFVAPLAGVYAAVRLVLPVAPDWVLSSIEIMSMITAVYAAGLALVQTDARRFCAYLFLSHSSVVLVGLETHTSISLTGALCLWQAVILSLGGFGLTLRALEARFGRLSLTEFRGLYEQSPTLAACFLLTGLASVGFPGTFGFVASEILVDGVVGSNLVIGLGVVLAAAINGIAVVRAYFLLFTGTRHYSTVSLGITSRERVAVLTLAAIILGAGLFPQPAIGTRHEAAEWILRDRERRVAPPTAEPTHGTKHL